MTRVALARSVAVLAGQSPRLAERKLFPYYGGHSFSPRPFSSYRECDIDASKAQDDHTWLQGQSI